MMGLQKIYSYVVKSDVSNESDLPDTLRAYREMGVLDLVQFQDLNILPPQV